MPHSRCKTTSGSWVTKSSFLSATLIGLLHNGQPVLGAIHHPTLNQLMIGDGKVANVALDPIINPWDIAALVRVVRGAGGVITDWQGAAAYPAESTVAAGPGLHSQVIAALAARNA